MRSKKKGYGLWMIVTIILTLATVSTVMPQASASKECLLGYLAHCSFTPVSTVLCAIATAAVCAIRKKKYTEPA